MKSYKISKEELQNFLINRSFLHKKSNSIETILSYYQCIQVDPVSVVAKNHELMLWNRVNGFKIRDLYAGLYKTRKFFEYWLQLYSIIPIDNFALLKAKMELQSELRKDFQDKFKNEIGIALKFIKKNGPTSYKDIQHLPEVDGLFSWHNKKNQKALLEYLWDTGQIMINHRKGIIKYYDITDRILTKKYIPKGVSLNDSLDFIIKSNFSYLGIVRPSFMMGRVGRSLKNKVRRRFSEIKDKEFLQIQVPGIKTVYFMQKKQLEELKKYKDKNLHRSLSILPPLDPLIIDRKMIEEIFGFYYRWEIYTPEKKRNFGHYGMPLLYKSKFIGQVQFEKMAKAGLRIKKINVSLPAKEKKSFNNLLKKRTSGLESLIFEDK